MRNTGFRLCVILATGVCVSAAHSQVLPEDLVPAVGRTLDGTEIIEDECQVLSTNAGEEPELRAVPGMYVLDRTEEEPLQLFSTEDVTLNAVICWRSAPRFAPNDYLIPELLGIPLYIKTDFQDEDANRTMILEKRGGRFRVRLLAGPEWSESEGEQVIQTLQHFELQINGGD